MRLAKWKGLLTLFFICFTVNTVVAADPAINWQSYQSGMKKIDTENKKGFIHFYTDWCTYCKLMNQKTFTDASIIDYLNQNFVPIRVNAEKQRQVAKKYGVNKFPNSWFIAEDQSEIGRRPGFIPADILLKMLQYIASDDFKTMSFQAFMEDHQ